MADKSAPGVDTGIPTVFHQPTSLTSEEEERRHLDEAVESVKRSIFNMNRSLDRNFLHEALKNGTMMLNELRTNVLSPTNYLQLWMTVTNDGLLALERYFLDEVARGRHIEELYEMVQHAGNIIPRLYLLITVGSVYIRTKKAPAKDILKDLVEMCKGVQHPTRGLFLRHYLVVKVKPLLPDKGNEYEGAGGSVNDSINFLLQNFTEMVRLWVRMEKANAPAVRKSLEDLVGGSIQRLAQLDGVDLELYRTVVLPRLVKIIVQSGDAHAQEYLVGTLVAAFSDDFQVATLDIFLEAVSLLGEGVDRAKLLCQMAEKVAAFAADPAAQRRRGPEEAEMLDKAFDLFLRRAFSLAKDGKLSPSEFLTTISGVVAMTLRISPEATERVNLAFDSVAAAVDSENPEGLALNVQSADAVRRVKRLLALPVELFGAIGCITKVKSCATVIASLPFAAQRSVCLERARSLVTSGSVITDHETCEAVFDILRPLIVEDETTPAYAERYADDDEFVEEQALVARTIHIVRGPTLETQLRMLQYVRRVLGQVQADTKRLPHTLPPLVFAFLRAVQAHEGDSPEHAKLVDKGLDYARKTLAYLADAAPMVAFRLHLQVALTANALARDTAVYDALASALEIYDSSISRAREQMDALTALIGVLPNITALTDEQFGAFAQQVCRTAVGLVQKRDQAIVVALCAFAFARDPSHPRYDADRAFRCLQKAVEITDSRPTGQHPALMLLVAQYFLYFAEKGVTAVTPAHLSYCFEQVAANLPSCTAAEAKDDVTGVPLEVCDGFVDMYLWVYLCMYVSACMYLLMWVWACGCMRLFNGSRRPQPPTTAIVFIHTVSPRLQLLHYACLHPPTPDCAPEHCSLHRVQGCHRAVRLHPDLRRRVGAVREARCASRPSALCTCCIVTRVKASCVQYPTARRASHVRAVCRCFVHSIVQHVVSIYLVIVEDQPLDGASALWGDLNGLIYRRQVVAAALARGARR